MINHALDTIKNEIQQYLLRLPELNLGTSEKVVLCNVINDDGTFAIPKDTLGVSLVNIEEERLAKSHRDSTKLSNGQISHRNPDIKLNLYILIAANFTDYLTATKFLSGAIRFFQSKSVFTPRNSPSLDPSLEKLLVEMYTLDFEQQNHLWGTLGGKFLPSVTYKVRLVTIQEDQTTTERPPIQLVDVSPKRK